jgi:Methyltransferase domain
MRVASVTTKLVSRLYKKGGIDQFSHQGDRPATEGSATEVEELFWSNDGPIVHKWHHYLPIYDRYLTPWRGRPVRMLEIGVSRGGSMALWRKFLGPDAVLFGIDIDPGCAAFNGQAAEVRIGSQADPDFLRAVVEEMGGLDIVLDDGSHVSKHIRASLDTLYPLLADGGLYIIEDLHACYWGNFGGGYRRAGSFIEVVKEMIDDMHHWYHDKGQEIAATAGYLGAMHVHDSLVVLEKIAVTPPRHTQRGRE